MSFVIVEADNEGIDNIHAMISKLEADIQNVDLQGADAINLEKFEEIQYQDREYPNLPVLHPHLFGLPTGLKHPWKQFFASTGEHILFQGTDCCDCCGNCNLISKNTIILWVGTVFLDHPSKRHIVELKGIVGNQMFARINLEEMVVYDKPMIVFGNERFLLRGSERFVLMGYLEGPLPKCENGGVGIYQNIMMLGKAFSIKQGAGEGLR